MSSRLEPPRPITTPAAALEKRSFSRVGRRALGMGEEEEEAGVSVGRRALLGMGEEEEEAGVSALMPLPLLLWGTLLLFGDGGGVVEVSDGADGADGARRTPAAAARAPLSPSIMVIAESSRETSDSKSASSPCCIVLLAALLPGLGCRRQARMHAGRIQ